MTLFDYSTILAITENLNYDDLENLQKAGISEAISQVALRRQQRFLGSIIYVGTDETEKSFIQEEFYRIDKDLAVSTSKVLNRQVLPRSVFIDGDDLTQEGDSHTVADVEQVLRSQLDISTLTLCRVDSAIPFLDAIDQLNPFELELMYIEDWQILNDVVFLLRKGCVKRLTISNCDLPLEVFEAIVDFAEETPDWQLIDISEMTFDSDEERLLELPNSIFQNWASRRELLPGEKELRIEFSTAPNVEAFEKTFQHWHVKSASTSWKVIDTEFIQTFRNETD